MGKLLRDMLYQFLKFLCVLMLVLAGSLPPLWWNDNRLVNETRGDAVAIVVDRVVSLDEGLADLFLVQVGLVVGYVSDGNGCTHKTPLAVRHHGIRFLVLLVSMPVQRIVGVLVWVCWPAEVKVGVDHGAGGQHYREDQG